MMGDSFSMELKLTTIIADILLYIWICVKIYYYIVYHIDRVIIINTIPIIQTFNSIFIYLSKLLCAFHIIYADN
jgi:hypothetical protein